MDFIKLVYICIITTFLISNNSILAADNLRTSNNVKTPSKAINKSQPTKKGAKMTESSTSTNKSSANGTTPTATEIAILAGGCFWGVEELIRNLPGVVSTEVGYTGGNIPNPNYDIVKRGASGHAESIKIEFDPKKISYEELLKFYFKIHDPTTKNQQGNDIGSQYRSAIFYMNEEQKKIANKVKELVDISMAWKKPVVTEIVRSSTFYPAEGYHQDYLQKNPGGYTCHYIRDLKF